MFSSVQKFDVISVEKYEGIYVNKYDSKLGFQLGECPYFWKLKDQYWCRSLIKQRKTSK